MERKELGRRIKFQKKVNAKVEKKIADQKKSKAAAFQSGYDES